MNSHGQKRLLQEYSAQKIIQALQPMVTPARWQKMQQVSWHRLEDLSVAVEGVWDLHNALAIVRSGEALGIDCVSLVDCDYKKGEGKQTMRGSDAWMPVHDFDKLEEFITFARTTGWKLAGACPRGNMDLSELPADQKICLLLGNEHRGLSEPARAACDYLYRIPMFGMVESLNLSVAGAISLYDLASRKRMLSSPHLTPTPSYEERLAQFLIHSVGLDRASYALQIDSQAAPHP